jgi:hypothetical protein
MRIKSCLPHVLVALALVACGEDSKDSGTTDDAVDEPDAASDDRPSTDDTSDDHADDVTDEDTDDDATDDDTDDDATSDDEPSADDTATVDDETADDADDASDDSELGDAGNDTETTSEPAQPDAGVDAGNPAPSLCAKYGGAGVVDSVVKNQVLGAIADDCRINVFFTSLTSDGLTRVADCLSIQVQELFGCEGVVYAGSEASNGLACRSMADAHLGLGISAGDFNALIEDVVAGLTAAGVEAADIGAAAPALLGMQDDIVEDSDEGTTHMMCTVSDAGAEADAGSGSDAGSDMTWPDAGWMDAGVSP